MTGFVRTRRFWPLFGSYCLGAFADNALRMATILAIYGAYTLTLGNPDAEGAFALPGEAGNYAGNIASAAFTLPVLLFSILAGVIADRVAGHHLIKLYKVVEVMLMGFAGLCFYIGNAPLLIFALFLMGAQSAFFVPVRNAVMPQLYRDDELIRANGYYTAGLFVAIISGLLVGSYFVNRDGGRMIVSLTLISASSIGLLLAIFVPRLPRPAKTPTTAVKGGLLRSMARHNVIWPMLGIGWFWLVGAVVLANLPNYNTEVLAGGDPDFAILQVTFAVGAGIGCLLAGIVGGRMTHPLLLSTIGLCVTIVGSVAIWHFSGVVPGAEDGLFRTANMPLLISLAITAGANGVFAVPLMAAVQRRAPEDRRARMMGVSNMTNGLFATIGALIVIPMREAGADAADVFVLTAILQVVVLALIIFRWKTFNAAATAPQKPGSNTVA